MKTLVSSKLYKRLEKVHFLFSYFLFLNISDGCNPTITDKKPCSDQSTLNYCDRIFNDDHFQLCFGVCAGLLIHLLNKFVC